MDRQKLKIASPCSKNFDEMEGEGSRRFCEQCEKHVHNLSDLTRPEAIRLLKSNAESGLCVVYTFDSSNRVRFQEEMGFKRPPQAQFRGIKRLLAAAAMVPILATLPACDSTPNVEEIFVLDAVRSNSPCDLQPDDTFRPIDAIIEGESRFLEAIEELLGFVPEYQMIAGEPAIASDIYEPDVMGKLSIDPEPQVVREMGEVEFVPEPVPEPSPAIIKPPRELMMLGDVAEPLEAARALEQETHEYFE